MAIVRIECLAPDCAAPSAPAPAYQTCMRIRHEVFVEGQAVPAEIEFDGLDPEARHFLAFSDDRPEASAVGTARMRIVAGVAKAERIAVLEAARGTGIGRALVRAIEEASRREGVRQIRLNAQVQAEAFYAKLGYVAEGEVFIEAGIDHRAMQKSLDHP